jgi:putative nucleotidyltransferase with HDIG domain
VARRLVSLFLLSAVVPTSSLAVISYYSVTSYLEAQARQRVHTDGKHLGLGLLMRLQQADGILAWHVGAAQAGPERQPARRRPPHDGLGQIVQVDTTAWAEGRVTPAGWPAATSEQLARLARGEALVLTVGTDSARDIWIVRTSERNPGAVALALRVPPDVMNSALDEWLPEGSRAEVRDAGGRIVARAAKGLEVTREAQEGTSWTGTDREWLSDVFTLPMHYEFGAGTWTVTTGQPRGLVYAPTSGFLRQFLLVIAFGLIVVALLTLSQVRRQLVPLEQLHSAVRRISGRDFGTPVQVVSRDEFGDLADGFNEMRDRLRRQFHALSAAADLDHAILSTLDTERIVATLLDRLPDVLPCSMAALSIIDPELDTTSTAVRVGGARAISREPALDTADVFSPPRVTQWVAPCGDGAPAVVARAVALGAARVLVVPMVVSGRVAAVLAIGRADARPFDDEDHDNATRLANQAAVALTNAALVKRLDRLSVGALNALARAIDAKSNWTAGHSERVTELGLALGREVGLDATALAVFRRGGLLHDIGKIGIPAAILDKPGALTADEWSVMRQHPELGARILAPLPEYAEVIPIVLEHHEKYDGSGYPRGLAGEAISLGGRIFAVADVYDALTSQRPYRPGLPPERALAIIAEGRGTHFDPTIADAFMDLMHRRLGTSTAA